MIFDTHAHYDDEKFDEDRENLLMSIKDQNIMVVNVGASFKGCLKSYEFATKYDFMYGAIGLHPDEIGELTEENFAKMKEMATHEKIVAIGEIGLDYHWMVEEKELQKQGFIKQMNLARELGLPINVHSRDASEDTLNLIKEYGRDLGGIIHCFSGSKEIAMEYLKLSYYIGVGGVVTFKNSKKLKEVVEAVPLDRLVLETDCPYLAPEPNRGKRNDSRNLIYVAEEIANIKGIRTEEVIEATYKNALNVYGI